MRILVVDDDALAGEMTQAVLEDIGYDCLFVENGVEALETLATDSAIGMVISDLNMPLLSGIDLFREMRGQGLMLPFILLTGDDPKVATSEEPNLDACLLKDFSIEESLPAIINQVLQHHGINP